MSEVAESLFPELEVELTEVLAESETVSFDYADKKGNKAARSYVASLRKLKAAFDKARKEEKAEILERGRKIDAEAKESMEQIEALIEIHAAPLKAAKEAEERRVAVLEHRVEEIRQLTTPSNEPMSADELRKRLHWLEEMVVNEVTFQEFEFAALKAKTRGIEDLKAWLADVVKREAEAAELERLRKEAEIQAEKARIEAETARLEQQKKDEDRRIAAAAAQAKADAEAAAEAEKEAIRQKAADDAVAAKAASEQREKELLEAAEAAGRAAAQAKAEAKADAKRKANQEAYEQEKRAENKRIRNRVMREARDTLMSYSCDEAMATEIVERIVNGEIAHVQIVF